MSIDLSIIVCTHNRYEVLPQAIASVEIQDLPSDRYELLIVDNSTASAAQDVFLSELEISCQHRIIVERIPGLSRARNIGVQAAKGRYVSFMDDDARAPANWASEILGAFERHELAAAIGGPVRPIWPTPSPTWLHPWLEGFLTIVDHGDSERPLDANEWLAGTNIAFQRERLIAAGLFEERLGRIGKLLLSNEELNVANNLRAAGYSVIYNPGMEMNHTVHIDRISQKWMRQRIFWQTISDFFADSYPDEPFEKSVGKILDYQARLPPKYRGLPGFFLDVESPELFFAQTQAFAEMLRLMADDARDWREYLTVME